MYDWIPMEFDYDFSIDIQMTGYVRYHCIANDIDRTSFQVFHKGNLVLSTYSRDAVIEALTSGSKINGMTMDELHDSYYIGNEESTIDIGSLI